MAAPALTSDPSLCTKKARETEKKDSCPCPSAFVLFLPLSSGFLQSFLSSLPFSWPVATPAVQKFPLRCRPLLRKTPSAARSYRLLPPCCMTRKPRVSRGVSPAAARSAARPPARSPTPRLQPSLQQARPPSRLPRSRIPPSSSLSPLILFRFQ